MYVDDCCFVLSRRFHALGRSKFVDILVPRVVATHYRELASVVLIEVVTHNITE
jgi:hypothetical protein